MTLASQSIPATAPSLEPARVAAPPRLRTRNLLICLLPGMLVWVAAFFLRADQLWPIPRNDYLQFYASARLLGTPDLYSLQANQRLQLQLTHAIVPLVPCRPPFQSLLHWPIARLPFVPAFLVWEGLLASSIVAFLFLMGRRNPELWVMASLSLPLINALLNGQDTPLLLLALAGALLLADRRPFLAGLLLCACAMKFHLFLFLPFTLVALKRWQMLAGAAAGSAALLAVSFALAGPRWPIEWLAMLRQPELNPDTGMLSFHSLLTTFGLHLPVVETLVTAGIALLVVGIARRSRSLPVSLAAVVVAGLLTGYHVFGSDFCLLLFGLACLYPCPGRATGLWMALVILPPVHIAALAGLETPALAIVNLALGALLASLYLADPAPQTKDEIGSRRSLVKQTQTATP